jgi:hypothetical protein
MAADSSIIKRIRGTAVLSVIVTMIAILVLSALLGTYVAFPHRGKAMPTAEWLGTAMNRASAALPILNERERAALRR